MKTDIPAQVEDSYKLAQKLAEFSDSIDEVGRTKIYTNDEIAVSIVDPYQYRDEVRRAILNEVRTTTTALGPDYRVVLKGLDGPVSWSRSGDLNLAFYMNYDYLILPTSLHMYQDNG